ncbi:hypothetical protein [Agrococcus sp. ARC_14]|uniref:hypothetical protein n=1 Tax=Agrococcus sp. ARC_14 TaxID=2919927 RepID=UPI001F05A4DE|nr:hypothetical protein [Agrococcus sp. ARC_14]
MRSSTERARGRRRRPARSATLPALALLLVAALAGCTPGALAPMPEPSTTAPAVGEPSATPTSEPVDASDASPALLVTLAASDGLAILDPEAADALLDVVEVGQAPWGVAAHDGTAYVSTAEGLAVVDLATRSRTALVSYEHQPSEVGFGEYRDGGLGIAVAPDGEHVYVAVHRWPDPAWLEVYDVDEERFTGSVDVGIRPFDVLADPAGEWVATIDHDSYTVSIVDTASGFDPQDLEVRQVEIAPFGNLGFAGWEKPHYASITADGRMALPYQGLVTVLLDPATGETERIETTANSHQHGIATAPDGTLVAAGTGPFGTATGQPNASFLDPATGEEEVVALEHPHETVAIWQPADDAAWQAVLAGGFTRDGWWDGLTLIDPASGAVREIPLEGRPQHVIAAELPAR